MMNLKSKYWYSLIFLIVTIMTSSWLFRPILIAFLKRRMAINLSSGTPAAIRIDNAFLNWCSRLW